jgi:hypothetical protein
MVMKMDEHPDREVQAAIVRLADALCSFERATGIESVVIIRETSGFCARFMSGKPNIPDDIPDNVPLKIIQSKS